MGDERLAESVGDLNLTADQRSHADYVVRGFIPDSAQVSGDAVLMDIGAAQLATGKTGPDGPHPDQTPAQAISTSGRAAASRPAGGYC